MAYKFNPFTGNFDEVGVSSPSAIAWGDITGIISDQIDLQSALDDKQDTLVSGTNLKTVNGNSLLGSGNLVISGSGLTALQVFSAVSIRM